MSNVAWLPDSSGFIFSREGGFDLLNYDVSQRTQRVVVGNAGFRTTWPAVSPDGKRVAVARLRTAPDKPGSLEVLIYDLAGKELQHSAMVEWGGPGSASGSDIEATHLFWAPDGEKLIVSGSLLRTMTGIYDVKNDRMTTPGIGFPVFCGGTPTRPDGKGFLVAIVKDNKVTGLAFVDWEGRQQDIAVREHVDEENYGLVPLAPLYTSRWEGDIAVIAKGAGIWRIDTAKRTATFDPQGRKAPRVGAAEVAQEYGFDGRATLRVLYLEEGSGKDKRIFSRVEALPPKDGKARVLVEKKEGPCLLFPAPNKEMLALRLSDKILVVNRDGKVIADLATNK